MFVQNFKNVLKKNDQHSFLKIVQIQTYTIQKQKLHVNFKWA